MKKARRILALAGIVLLLGMYLVLAMAAVCGAGEATTLFKAALGCTLAVPVVLYALLLSMRVFGPKKPSFETADEEEKEE